MKASELRIGNLVFLTKDNFKTSYPYEMEGNDIYKVDESGCLDIRPIPLTEEWLFKMGYKEYLYKNNYLFTNGHLIWKCNDLFICDKNGVVLKYVHQLQNFYFAISGGKELTIKL